jgi:hypothetical protein
MQGDAEQSLACALGVTGKMIRKALVARAAPHAFRESLLRSLVEGRLDPSFVERSRVARAGRAAERPPQLG